jgi:hypothetical protein
VGSVISIFGCVQNKFRNKPYVTCPVLCEFGTAISKRYACFCCLFKIVMSGLLCLIWMSVKTVRSKYIIY